MPAGGLHSRCQRAQAQQRVPSQTHALRSPPRPQWRAAAPSSIASPPIHFSRATPQQASTSVSSVTGQAGQQRARMPEDLNDPCPIGATGNAEAGVTVSRRWMWHLAYWGVASLSQVHAPRHWFALAEQTQKWMPVRLLWEHSSCRCTSGAKHGMQGACCEACLSSRVAASRELARESIRAGTAGKHRCSAKFLIPALPQGALLHLSTARRIATLPTFQL